MMLYAFGIIRLKIRNGHFWDSLKLRCPTGRFFPDCSRLPTWQDSLVAIFQWYDRSWDCCPRVASNSPMKWCCAKYFHIRRTSRVPLRARDVHLIARQPVKSFHHRIYTFDESYVMAAATMTTAVSLYAVVVALSNDLGALCAASGLFDTDSCEVKKSQTFGILCQRRCWMRCRFLQ